MGAIGANFGALKQNMPVVLQLQGSAQAATLAAVKRSANKSETLSAAFYLAGRNSAPTWAPYQPRPSSPYGLSSLRATRYTGSSALQVTYRQRITTEPGKTPDARPTPILGQGSAFSILPCNNQLDLAKPTLEELAEADNPTAVQKAINDSLAEIAALMKPVFYQDSLHTLFMEPDVVERTIEEWQTWVTPKPPPQTNVPEYLLDPDKFKQYLEPAFVKPWEKLIDPLGPLINPAESLANVRPGQDWLVNPATGLLFDGQVIGPQGGVDLAIVPAAAASEAIARGAATVAIHPGSAIAAENVALVADEAVFAAGGLAAFSGGLNLVGGDGFNAALQQNFGALRAQGLAQ
jgi:hypothetical protein